MYDLAIFFDQWKATFPTVSLLDSFRFVPTFLPTSLVPSPPLANPFPALALPLSTNRSPYMEDRASLLSMVKFYSYMYLVQEETPIKRGWLATVLAMLMKALESTTKLFRYTHSLCIEGLQGQNVLHVHSCVLMLNSVLNV